MVASTAPDSDAKMKVWRNGQTVDLQATLGELPNTEQVASASGEQDEGQSATTTALGMHFAPLTSQARRDYHVGKDIEGVVVSQVDPGSAADDVGLSHGDVIVAINQQPVKNPQQAAAKLKEAASSQSKSALLLLNRHGVTQYVGVNLGDNQG